MKAAHNSIDVLCERLAHVAEEVIGNRMDPRRSEAVTNSLGKIIAAQRDKVNAAKLAKAPIDLSFYTSTKSAAE